MLTSCSACCRGSCWVWHPCEWCDGNERFWEPGTRPTCTVWPPPMLCHPDSPACRWQESFYKPEGTFKLHKSPLHRLFLTHCNTSCRYNTCTSDVSQAWRWHKPNALRITCVFLTNLYSYWVGDWVHPCAEDVPSVKMYPVLQMHLVGVTNNLWHKHVLLLEVTTTHTETCLRV